MQRRGQSNSQISQKRIQVTLCSGMLGVTLSQGELAKLKADRVNARLDYEVFRAKLYAAHPELAAQADGPNEGITVEDAAKLLPSADSALLQFVVTDERTYLFVL